MKKFNVTYTYEVLDEVTIEAKNETEAFQKFRKLFPDVDFDKMWELREKDKSYVRG